MEDKTCRRNMLGWSIHEAALNVYNVVNNKFADTYVWIDEVIAEAKKTLDSEDIKLLPKTPSAKRNKRQRVAAQAECGGRTLRSASTAVNRASLDSGVDVDLPKRTRVKKLSKAELKRLQKESEREEEFADSESEEQSVPATKRNAAAVSFKTTRKLSKVQELHQTKDETAKISDSESVSRPVLSPAERRLSPNVSEVTGCIKQNKVTPEVSRAIKVLKKADVAAATLSDVNKGKVVQDEIRQGTEKLKGTKQDGTLSQENLVKGQVSEVVDVKDDSVTNLARTPTKDLVKGRVHNQRHSERKAEADDEEKMEESRENEVKKQTVGQMALKECTVSICSNPKSVTPCRLSSPRLCEFAAVTVPKEDTSVSSEAPIQPAEESSAKLGTCSTFDYQSGPRLSLSKRRSESVGHKARLAEARRSRSQGSRTSGKAAAEVLSSSTKENECPSSPAAGDKSDSDIEIMDTPPKRVTRSKMRQPLQAIAALPALGQPEMRVTRSKMRVPPKQAATADSSDETPVPGSSAATFQVPTNSPSTVTKAKGTKVQELQRMLCQDPSFGLRQPPRGKTVPVPSSPAPRSAAQRKPVKRPSDGKNDSGSPPKRQCRVGNFFSPSEGSCYQVPVQTSIVKGAELVHSSLFLGQLKKKATTPVHSSVTSMVTSFIQRNTPKILTHEEIQEKKRKELEAKTKKMEEIAAKRNELKQKKLEEQRRQREEQRQQVLRRKQEMDQQLREAALSSKKPVGGGSTQKLDEPTSRMATRHQADERTKAEQQEKQKLREKRFAEVEQRRKQEEEAKRLQLLEQEKEKQLQEEQARRRREQEELERQQKYAELRRAEEERRARLDRERQQEVERQRQAEELRRKEELERQRMKEEQERKERAEKERQELERQRERERQKQLEIERQKEAERIRLAEEKVKQDEERRIREEQRMTQKAIEKHNQSQKTAASGSSSTVSAIYQQTTQALKAVHVALTNIAGTSAGNKPAAETVKQKPETAAPLNKTFDKEPTSESYAMTPKATKVRKPASSENYDIGDLHSDDSTDEEDKPRKKIPLWAQGSALKVALINQHCNPPDIEKLFGDIYPPDLNEVFPKKKKVPTATLR